MMISTRCVAICYVGIFAMVSSQTPPQVGDMRCILDTSTGIVKATMAIYKKTAQVTRTYFTKPSAYDFEYTGTGCQWTGTGTDSDPFIAEVEIDSQTNLPPTNKNGCGYEITNAQDHVYRWTAYNQKQYEYGREGDVVFTFECSSIANSVSVQVVFNTAPYEGIAQRIKPENQMSVLERYSGSNIYGQVVTDGITIGQPIKLRIQTKVKVNSLRKVGLDHYGVYPFYCDYRPGTNGSPTLFIQLNGCANSVFSALLGTGFTFAQFTTANAASERWFQTETNAFVLVPSTPTNDYYHITCYVGYCYGTEGSDGKCSDYCGTNARSRRSISNTTGLDSVSIRLKVKHELYNESEEEKQSDGDNLSGFATQTVIIIVATVVAVLLSAVIVAAVVVCCCQRRRLRSEKGWSDSSTTDSRKNLSFHTADHLYRYPKY